MMNEQFPALVRRHLVDTANERPADGQLEAVVALTATRTQQPSWYVRLRWLVSPAAPYANAGLRYALVVAALALVAVMIGVLAAGAGPGGRTVFEGRWTSIDTADSSIQTMIVGDGLTPSVHFEDDFSVNCERQGDAVTRYTADGSGDIRLNRLVAHFPEGGCVAWRVGPADWFYDHQASTDTLLDYQGITWHRAP